MTLAKQLWIGLSLMLTLVLLGTLSINLYHAKTYLEEQLYTKNLDNANILSGIIAASDGDDEIKLRIQAYYDLGHYRKITFIDPKGQAVVDMHIQPSEEEHSVPAWFMQVFHIVSHPGVATVSKGWKQLGQLTIVSHEAQAYSSLWSTVTQMAAWFVLSLILFGGIALYLLAQLTKTLRSVVNQANAIGDRRFILSPVPYTKELKQLVQTMNRMTRRVRRLLAKDANRIEALRQEAHLDQLTALFNRAHFVNTLNAEMQDNGVLSDGTLLYLKVEGLEEFNQRQGWATADAILKQVALWLQDLQKNEPEMLLARLGGGSFGLVIPIWQSLSQLEERLNLLWREWKVEHAEAVQLNLAIGDAQMSKTSSVDSLIENALSRAGMFGASSITASTPGRHDNYDLSTWEQLIHDALAQGGLKFELHPVVSRNREVLHQEVSARLSLPGSEVVYSAGQFMPWAVRTHQVVAIDTAILQAAFARLLDAPEPLALNLDIHSLSDASFVEELNRLTQANPNLASLLHIEVLAKSALEQWQVFSQGAKLLQSLGIKLGIDNVGHDALDFTRLESLGLHYIKLHPAIVAADVNIASNQILLGNLLLLARGLGLKVMANGVTTELALTQLFALALDGATGPVFKNK